MEGKILKRLHYRFILGALMILLITSPSFSQAPAPDAFSIQRIEVTETASGPRVAIEGSKSFKYNVFRLTDPLRVVIEVPRAQLGKIAGPVEVKDGTINVIQNRQIEDPQKQGARIEIGLDHLVEYDVVPEGNFLYLNFRKPPIPPPKEVKEEEKKEPEKKEAAPAAPLRKAKSLKEIEVSVKVDGVKVDIKGDGLIPEYKSFELASPTRLVVDLADLSNASGKKEINVGSRLLKHIRIGQHPDKVRLVFDVSGAKLPPYQLTREGQELKLTLGEVKKEAPKEEKAPVAEGPKPIPHEAVIILSGIDYWFAKGNEFANASRWQEAREAYTRAIKLNPKYAPAFYARGVACSWLGDYRQAIRDFDKAIELNYSRDDLAYYHRGVAYSKLGDHGQAIRNYDKAIQLEPKYAPAFYARGVAYFKLGDHRQAIRNYDKALELDPKGADTYYDRGIAYGKLGDSYRETMDYKTAAKLGYKPAQDFLKSKGISW